MLHGYTALHDSLMGAGDAWAQAQAQRNQFQQQLQLALYQEQMKRQYAQQDFQQNLQNQQTAAPILNKIQMDNQQAQFGQNMQNYQKYAPMFNNPGGGMEQQPQGQPPQGPPSLQGVIGQMPQGQQPAMSMAGGGVGTASGQPFDLGSALARVQQGGGQQPMGQPQQQQGQNPFVLNPAAMMNSGKIQMMKNPNYSNKSTQSSPITGLDISQLKQANTPEERQAILDKLPPEVAKNVQMAGEYNLDSNKIYGLRNNSGDRAKFDALVGLAYPGFDMKKYPQQQAYINDLAKGKLNQQVVALNTVKKHLDTFDQSIDALNNGNWSPKNAVINAAKELSGDPSITDFRLAQRIVYSEMERLLTGVGVTQQGLSHVSAIISGNSGYRQMKDNVALLKTIINGRIQPLRTQYKNIMGQDESGQIVFPNQASYDSGGTGGQQGAQSGQQGVGGQQDYSSLWN